MNNAKVIKEDSSLKALPSDQALSSSLPQGIIPKEVILQNRITHESKIPDIEPTVFISNVPFAVKGDISVVGGLPKAGKTAISAFILATAIKEINYSTDTISIRSTFCNKAPVFYIDTEQNSSTTNKIRNTVCRLIGEEIEPDYLYIINLRRHARADEKKQIVLSLFHHFPEARLWIIDGLADLVNDPNNVSESFPIIGEFMSMAEKLRTSIIFYLHENPGSMQKLRGNLGSEIERKCFGAITVRKDRDKGYHWIEARMLRGSADFDHVYFTYDTDRGHMRSLNAEEKQAAENNSNKAVIEANKLRTLAELATDNGKLCPINFEALWPRVMDCNVKVYGKAIKERACADKVKKMLESGIFNKNDNGMYILAQDEE